MGSGDFLYRSFSVRVDNDLISGSLLINDDYRTFWYETELGGILSMTGEAVTTTVIDVGLVDSYKLVEPSLSLPGPDNVLTYYVHIVNSSQLLLEDVKVHDTLPWQYSTYQRDAVASAGKIVSDIVSIDWTGDVAPLSEEVITFTVLVDPYYSGALTNTATITHPGLLEDVEVQVVAYVTDKPVLQITKSASPNPVRSEETLTYKIKVTNLGQQATALLVTDTLPANVEYIAGSSSGGGLLVGEQMQWQIPVLEAGESLELSFQVTVLGGKEVVNEAYGVICAEGVSATGLPVTTQVTGGGGDIYLPFIAKQ